MSYTWYEVFWFFLLYSFAGWVIGTSGAALKEKKFIDVGFLFGPWCPSYGFGAVGFALFLPELKDQPVFLFAGGVILSFIITSFTGVTLERISIRNGKIIPDGDLTLVAMLTYLIR